MYSESFLLGYFDCAPSDSRVNLAIGTNNYGPYVNYASGQAWANVVNTVNSWINSQPGYAVKLGVTGAIDSELQWNSSQASLDWKNGYTSSASIFYLYYGDCSGCPSKIYPNWIPDNGWTLENVYQMSSTGYAFNFPEIYSVDRSNARQWQYVSLYSKINYGNPIGFLGVLTQSKACQQRNNCSSNTSNATDNPPEEGWEQLWGELYNDPNTTVSDIPNLSDMSWDD